MRLRPALVLGLLVLTGGFASSCGPQRPSIRNVLLISIDTLRADHLGSYGFPRPTTPNIDALAREGVRFKNVYAPVPMTLPAHVSMLTGTLPPTHGLRDNLENRLPDASLTLAEMLKPRGFTTGAIVSTFVLDRRFGVSQGFDSYDDRFQAVHKIGDLSERKGDETTRLARQWLDEHRDRPFFFFVHFYDPHDPYEPPEPFASRWKGQPYEGEVAFADHCVGQIVEKLRQLSLYDSTLIVITGDHGEMLGQHGELNHGFFIYEGALKVPLVVRVPGAEATARQVDLPVSLIDIVPMVLSLVGAEVPREVQGMDVSPWLAGRGAGGGARPLYAETVTPTRYYGANSLLGVIADGWKYIETTRPELYDLRSDPTEAVNLIEREPARADALGRILAEILAAAGRAPGPAPESAALDEASRLRLAALGYLGHGGDTSSPGFDRTKEDPKDLIAFFRTDQRLNKLVEEKKYAQARALCEDMLQQRPGFADCHLQMSKIAAVEGDLKTALAAATKAVQLSPGKEPARLHLAGLLTQHGLALTKQGKRAAAIKSYRQALALDPDSAEAHAYLGAAMASAGSMDDAIVHFEQSLRAKPDHAELRGWLAAAHVNLGRAKKAQGKLDDAVLHYRRAIAVDPRLAAAHNNLGSALGSQGRLPEAIQEFREALRLQPDYDEARNNLELAMRMTEEGTQPSRR